MGVTHGKRGGRTATLKRFNNLANKIIGLK